MGVTKAWSIMQFFTKEASGRAGNGVYFADGSESACSYHYVLMIVFSTLLCIGIIGCLSR